MCKVEIINNIVTEIGKINPHFIDKHSVFVNDVHRLVEYLYLVHNHCEKQSHYSSCLAMNYSFTESTEVKLLNDLYKKSKECETKEELHNYISVMLSSRNPG